jgi:hypothetical protein
MKKYIFTEAQIKKVVDVVLNEQTILNEEHREVLKLRDLAELLARTGNDYDTLLSVLQDMYRSSGDEGVMELFKAGTGIELDNLSKGQYVIKY